MLRKVIGFMCSQSAYKSEARFCKSLVRLFSINICIRFSSFLFFFVLICSPKVTLPSQRHAIVYHRYITAISSLKTRKCLVFSLSGLVVDLSSAMTVELKSFISIKCVFMYSQKLKATHKCSVSPKQKMLCYAFALL